MCRGKSQRRRSKRIAENLTDATGQLILAHHEGRPSFKTLGFESGYLTLSGGADVYFSSYQEKYASDRFDYVSVTPEEMSFIAELGGWRVVQVIENRDSPYFLGILEGR